MDRTLTIGFVDLVGFHEPNGLDPEELAAMVDRFETIAYEHIPKRGGRVLDLAPFRYTQTIGETVISYVQ